MTIAGGKRAGPAQALVALAAPFARALFSRYLAASALALALDVAVYALLVSNRIEPAAAAALGYSAGILLHWSVSSRFVFAGKRRDGARLHVQRALFLGSALAGLGITIGVVALADRLGADAALAKAAATAISFVAVYIFRKYGVFR